MMAKEGHAGCLSKETKVSQRRGAWAGTSAYTDKGVARRFISQQRWEKTHRHLDALITHARSGLLMRLKMFQSALGFLVFVSIRYTFLCPFFTAVASLQTCMEKQYK
jgi:hypothetical protein